MKQTEFRNYPGFTATFEGTVEEVDNAIKVYFSNYNPAGYNTRIVECEVNNNVKTVKVTRWDNCD